MKVVIVGGGTAGWIAAYYLQNSQPNQHDITVIESSKIGIIGAGEGSTGIFVDLLNGYFFNKKIHIQDFIEKTNATNKMGIRHIGWSQNSNYFAPLDFSPTGMSLDDYIFKYVLCKFGNKKIHLASRIGINYENNNYSQIEALHFDGHLVGQYFKNICLHDGLNLIDSEVLDVEIESNGLAKSLILSSGEKIEADFFIDCTGFKKLFSKKHNLSWKSYSDILPVNTAMPFLIENKIFGDYKPETTARAMKNGWMWRIPLQNRSGCGYVFNNAFTSIEEAKKEIEDFLKIDINPIKIINFDSGHVEKFLYKNFISFGLSSSFVEPLEATSINNTIVQISIFFEQFFNNNFNYVLDEKNQTRYNEIITKLNDLTQDFISAHYQGGRTDSEFWMDIKDNNRKTKNVDYIINFIENKIPSAINFSGMYGSYSIPLLNWILSGMNLLNEKTALSELLQSNKYDIAEFQYINFYKNTIRDKKYIKYC